MGNITRGGRSKKSRQQTNSLTGKVVGRHLRMQNVTVERATFCLRSVTFYVLQLGKQQLWQGGREDRWWEGGPEDVCLASSNMLHMKEAKEHERKKLARDCQLESRIFIMPICRVDKK